LNDHSDKETVNDDDRNEKKLQEKFGLKRKDRSRSKLTENKLNPR
jgi:hypothetical protein